jgi:hypothetical protein|tara:strand:- start:252 stop:443 length:192 start_codon:yes stop_codon:yes gene_type:complete
MTPDKKEKLKVGDYVIPLVQGIMEFGDPPYIVTEIKDSTYIITQTDGTYKHTMKLPINKLRAI